MATDWNAMQGAAAMSADGKQKVRANPGGVLPRYMAGGSWCASLSKGGNCRRKLKGQTGGGISAKK